MRLMSRLRGEHGFTMAPIAIVGTFLSIVAAAGLAAARGDLNLTRNDLDHKQAYEAARAGLNDYAYHLNSDTNYWTRCTTVPTPSAVNQVGSTANRRSVPGNPAATYAIELLPANGRTACDIADPVGSMIEQSGEGEGTFRIRATGYANGSKQSIVASFKRASFLDYIYFTQLETLDPVTYGNADTVAGAYEQCSKTIAEGRETAPIPGSDPVEWCTRIYFTNNEFIEGPLHTNDALSICGVPTFGRTPADAIEVASPPQGWVQYCGTTPPNFLGTFVTNAPVLTPPPTNGLLKNIAQPAYRFTGQVRIVLNSNNTMTVSSDTNATGTTMALPSNGVVFVSNGDCSSAYTPYQVSYPNVSGCGNALVSGTYSGRLTIAAENDIIIEDDLIRTGNGMLGLISNNFIRIQHPVDGVRGWKFQCNSTTNMGGSQPNLRIDAAMLAIQHSFIVDNYDCGQYLGTLTVNGAIAQKFRGAVGTFGGTSTGYTKDYNYDDRLRYVSPPHFLDPVESAWHVQRETLDFP